MAPPLDTDTKETTFSGPMTRFGNQRVDEDENAEEGTTTVTTITTGTATNSTNEHAPTSTVQAQTNTSQDDPGTGTVETNLQQVEATQNPVENTLQIIAPIVESLTPQTLTVSPTGQNTPPSATPQANGEPGESGNSGAPVPPTPGSVAPKPNVTTVVGHFSNAFNSLAQGLGAASLKLAGAPFSQTPLTDVITAVQMMLSAIVNAVAEVAQVPKDLLACSEFPLVQEPEPRCSAQAARPSTYRADPSARRWSGTKHSYRKSPR